MKPQKSQDRQKRLDTHAIVLIAMFAAILCISAYISIPLPLAGSPHITIQNFVVLFIALLFPAGHAFLIVCVWMLLGMIGLPVFVAGASGIGYLGSAWGGYTVSFLLVSLVLPALRGRKYTRIRYTIVAMAGVLLIDLCGMLWLKSFVSDGYETWRAVFLTGFVPFLPMDVIKAVIVAQIMPAFRKIMY